MNKLKKIVAKAMNKRASEWKLGKLIAEDIEQEKKLHGAVPITNYAVYWNIQVFDDMKELDVPQLSKKAQDAIFDDIEVALQGGFSKGEIQLQKEDLEEEDIKILNEDLLLEFFLNFEEKDLSLDDVEIDLGNTYDGLPESYVKFRQLANKKKQVSKMASIISKKFLKSAKVTKKADKIQDRQFKEIYLNLIDHKTPLKDYRTLLDNMSYEERMAYYKWLKDNNHAIDEMEMVNFLQTLDNTHGINANRRDKKMNKLANIINREINKSAKVNRKAINNYTRPPEGEDAIEFDIYYSNDNAQMEFDDNIKRIGDKYVYVDFGNYNAEDVLQDNITITTTGYSQGDWAKVYIPKELKDDNSRKEYIAHLFWDSPVYGIIKINDEEIYVDELLSDIYEWDKDEILSKLKNDVSEKTYEYLKNNLPETLDYRG